MGVLRPTRARGAALAVLACAAGLSLGAASEAELKGALAFRVLRYVEWPRGATPPDRLRVTVLGKEPFAGTVQAMIDGERLFGRRVQVTRVPALEELPPSDVLVVSGSPASMDALAEALGDAPVLTVGDASGFARRGGMIGLVRDGPRVRLEVNREVLTARGLAVSSRLLGLATLVESQGS